MADRVPNTSTPGSMLPAIRAGEAKIPATADLIGVSGRGDTARASRVSMRYLLSQGLCSFAKM